MLDYFAIFHKGGALLWTLQFTTALKHNPVEALNALIRTCLMEERSADNAFTFTPKAGAAQSLKWTFHNGLGLVFVAVFQKTLSLLYVDELLARVRDEFAGHYKPGCYDYDAFTPAFAPILKGCESRAEAARKPLQARSTNQLVPAKGGRADAGKGAKGARGSSGKGSAGREGQEDADDEDGAAAAGASAGGSSADEGADATASVGGVDSADSTTTGVSGGFDLSRMSKLGVGKRNGSRPTSRRATKDDDEGKDKKEASPEKKGGKKARTWGNAKEEESKLDYSSAPPAAAASNGSAAAADGANVFVAEGGLSRMEEEDEEYSDDESDIEDAVAAATGKGASAAPAKRGVLGSFMSGLAMRVVGKGALERADIEPALADMKRKLMERNVAEEVSEQVVESLARSLEGQKLSSFTGISTFVKAEFEKALSGILNKRTVDVLHDIQRTNARGKPYVIVFCGVNGVGKSTNLAKIAYWLGSHGVKVQLAACDTFRAGAVEQLKTHAVRLGVPLYERGYEKDPAKVAAEAVRVAERDGRNVVLVDTAGRMQDNEPLMRALANLIHVNQPNLVLFVGEALVGNDAVDQLVKFARSLEDLAPAGANKRQHYIDGIVLTKFDTVDDKVGAAVSMVYKSGAPIMFVGCGQTYLDLKRLNVRSVVKSLLK